VAMVKYPVGIPIFFDFQKSLVTVAPIPRKLASSSMLFMGLFSKKMPT